jgi:hypothetical protein
MELIAELLGVRLNMGIDGTMDRPEAHVNLYVGRAEASLVVRTTENEDGEIVIIYNINWPSFNGGVSEAAAAAAVHDTIVAKAVLVESVAHGRSWKVDGYEE